METVLICRNQTELKRVRNRDPKFELEAIEAEEENSNKNDDGIYIETTTVTFRKVVANKEDNLPGNKNAQIVDIRQTSQVNGPLNLKSIEDKAEDAASKKPDVKPLEKLTRKDDTDVEVEDELLDLQKLSDIEDTTDIPVKVTDAPEKEDKTEIKRTNMTTIECL